MKLYASKFLLLLHKTFCLLLPFHKYSGYFSFLIPFTPLPTKINEDKNLKYCEIDLKVKIFQITVPVIDQSFSSTLMHFTVIQNKFQKFYNNKYSSAKSIHYTSNNLKLFMTSIIFCHGEIYNTLDFISTMKRYIPES